MSGFPFLSRFTVGKVGQGRQDRELMLTRRYDRSWAAGADQSRSMNSKKRSITRPDRSIPSANRSIQPHNRSIPPRNRSIRPRNRS